MFLLYSRAEAGLFFDETKRDETRRDETRRVETRRDESSRVEVKSVSQSQTLKILDIDQNGRNKLITKHSNEI